MMPEEEAPETEAHDEQEVSKGETESAVDEIEDWPAEAISPEEVDPQWTPGEVLGYAKKRPQKRASKVSPVVGLIAQWIGISAVVAVLSLLAFSMLLGRRLIVMSESLAMAVILALVFLAALFTLGAIILGTIGRLNVEGRRAATVGRRIGCGIPLSVLTLSLIGEVFSGDGQAALAVLAKLLIVTIVGCLIILITDAILGTD